MALRKIIEIDEEKCDGCGQCILACAEGALELVDGKARLVGDILCDGLGACIGECPQGALTIIEREGDAFDEEAVHERLAQQGPAQAQSCPGVQESVLACGCPSSAASILPGVPADQAAGAEGRSSLGHWPVKLQLLGPQAGFLKGSDLILLADCAAAANPNLHQKVFPGKAVAMGCPKLDDLDSHINRLAEILKGARPKSLNVMYMDVPCCKGFVHAAKKAVEMAGVDLPVTAVQISRTGEVLSEETLI